ncbi:MAG: hypothetical protein NTX89_02160 [Candidatus Omnitrophica bacterium]|nr:hypothetical protein [Candidatus Omnitrophota bacterium]
MEIKVKNQQMGFLKGLKMNKKEKLIIEFNQAMLNIYEEAKRKYDYNGLRFLQMIKEHGGLEAAKRIINDTNIKLQGFTELFMRGGQEGLNLTVEALVLDPKWRDLFTDADRKIASERMRKLDHKTA